MLLSHRAEASAFKIDQEAHAVQFFYFKVGLLKYFEKHFTSSQLPGVQIDSSQSKETEEHMNQPQLNPAEVQKQNNPILKKNLREQPGSAKRQLLLSGKATPNPS